VFFIYGVSFIQASISSLRGGSIGHCLCKICTSCPIAGLNRTLLRQNSHFMSNSDAQSDITQAKPFFHVQLNFLLLFLSVILARYYHLKYKSLLKKFNKGYDKGCVILMNGK